MGAESHTADTLLSWVRTTPGSDTILSSIEAASFVSLARMLGLSCDSYYAECRLGSSRQVDLLLSFSRRSQHSHRLGARINELRRRAVRESRLAWDFAAEFVARWLAPNDVLHRTVEAIWLEFDDVSAPHSSAAPSLSACIVPDYGRGFDAKAAAASNIVEALRSAYRALRGPESDEPMIRRLETVTAALPEGGRFIHLSWMAARQTPTLKLYGVMPRGELIPYLTRIGYSSPTRGLREALDFIAVSNVCGGNIYFDLNLSSLNDSRRSTFGLAFSQQHVVSCTPVDPQRRALLERLTAHGQCSVAQAEVLHAWADDTGRCPNSNWDALPVRRWLDIKTVFHGRDRPVSKAYLGFGPLRVPFALFAA